MFISAIKSYKNRTLYSLVTVLLFVLLSSVIFHFTTSSHLILKIFLIIIVCIMLSGIIFYVFNRPIKQSENLFIVYKWEFIQIFAIFAVYFPLLSQSYLFYDDYWGYTGTLSSQSTSLLNYARPLNALCNNLFQSVSFSNIYVLKWFSTVALIIFALLLMRWIYEKSQDMFISFFTTLAICVASAVIDSIGYASTFPFTLGIVGSAFSFIAFERFYKAAAAKKAIIAAAYLIIALSSLLVGFYSYQLATPIIFLLIAVCIFFNKKSLRLFKQIFLYGIFFASTAMIYMLSLKVMSAFYDEPLSSRGTLITSLVELKSKFIFFYQVVFKQSIYQLLDSIFGKILFTGNGRINALIIPTHHTALIIACCMAIFLIVFAAVLCLIRNRRTMEFLVLLFSIPLSYYTLFILQETSYTSYYSYPLLALLTFLFVMGCAEILNFLQAGFNKFNYRNLSSLKYLLAALVIVMSFQGNYYINNFWVQYNKSGYDYVKNTMAAQLGNTKWIHIYGVLYPGQGNVYSVFTAETALKELGYDYNSFKITCSDNQYYTSIIQGKDYKVLLSNLGKDEAKWINSVYAYDSVYNRYYINIQNPSQETLNKLRSCLVLGGVIPKDDSQAIIIDLRWTQSVK